MTQTRRPLSPHLQVYRWQISNTLSIIHRLTGLALTLGTVAFVGWLLTLAAGQMAYAQLSWIFGSLFGQLLILGWTFCFSYHLCSGVRHLAWDAGIGFDKAVARRSGIVVVVAALVLTTLFWALALSRGGA